MSTCCAAVASNECETGGPSTVRVVLDLDAATGGFQSRLTVPAGVPIVEDVAVFIIDPAGQHCVYGVGYLGGIDRGIALGHMPGDSNQGSVVGFAPALGAPVNPDNFAVIAQPPNLDPAFIGPEIQYIEGGAARAAALPGPGADPVFTLDILLEGTAPGDVFALYLLDYITVWSNGAGGAFSTQGFQTLDTGGDSAPDRTQTIYGVDPDVPLGVPPAAFPVDYVDGPPEGGPATITVVGAGDVDGNGVVDVVDLLLLLGAWGPCPDLPDRCPADLDGDGDVDVVDLLVVLANWS